MKRIRYRWPMLCLAALLILTVALCACGKDGEPPETKGPGTAESETSLEEVRMIAQQGQTRYTVVRPDDTDKATLSAATYLKGALSARGGCEMGISTDYDEPSEYEILIGDTNRPETAALKDELGGEDYLIAWVGEKLVAVGKDGLSLATAVRRLCAESFGFTPRALPQGAQSADFSLPETFRMSGSVSPLVPDPRQSGQVLVPAANVLAYGAVGNGVSDDTAAFQRAIDEVGKAGGGVVYAPAGVYYFKGSLTIRTAVYLCGEWYNPESLPERMADGTVFTVRGGSGSFVTVGASAGLMGLTICYPDLTPEGAKIGPTILLQDAVAGGGVQHASSLQCITVVNSMTAVDASQGLQLPTLRDVYVSALTQGFAINRCYDCARITTFHVSPSYWASFFSLKAEDVARAMRAGATGFCIMRTDAQMMYDLRAESCRVGISLLRDPSNTGETAGGSALACVRLVDCVVGIHDEYNSSAISDLEISVSGTDARCVELTSDMGEASTLRLYGCVFKNEDGPIVTVESGCPGSLMILSSRFESWKGRAVEAEGGILTLSDNNFVAEGQKESIYLGSGVLAAALTQNYFAPGLGGVEGPLSKDKLRFTASDVICPDASSFAIELPERPLIAGQNVLYSVLDFGAAADGVSDDTGAFAKALSEAGKAGGIVYVPAGYYRIDGHLTIPTGVELRGCSESLHVSSGGGSVLYLTGGQGDPDGDAALTLNRGSGVRGLLLWYPEQAWNDIRTYPFAIRVGGQDCLVSDICFGNCYRALDMGSADCGGHYVENLTGCVLNRGVVLDGSTKAGALMNVHFNLTFYTNLGNTARLSDESGDLSGNMFAPLLGYLNGNLDAYTFGQTKDELLLFVFNYRARYGMLFTGGFDGDIIGCGVDGSVCGVKITGSYDRELCLVSFSDDIVPGALPEGNAAVYVNTEGDSTVRFVLGGASSYNYVPSNLVTLKGGNLVLDGFSAGVTPAGGQGALRVEDGYAYVNGITFLHVGPLDGEGKFTRQPKGGTTYDVVVLKKGAADVYGAVGVRFFQSSAQGSSDFVFIEAK